MRLKIAIVQMPVKERLEENLNYIKESIAKSGAELIIFPELALTGYQKEKKAFNFCRIQKAIEELSFVAKREEKGVLLGLPVLEKDKIYNVAMLIDEKGELKPAGEKVLLYPEFDEPLFEPGRGKKLPIFKGLRLGVVICFELRSPEVARNLLKAGADLLIVIAQWPASRLFQWKTLLRARAIENQMPVIGVNALTEFQGVPIGGGSRIISSKGKVLARKKEAGILEHTLKVETPTYPYPLRTPLLDFPEKIINLGKLKPILEKRRKKGQKVVFTNGCFDLLHAGHVSYLREARKLGDILVLGLNTDSSIKKIKGPQRPINPEEMRAKVLSALECVDFIVLFEEETPERLIKEIKPDILVKGEDWEEDKIVGATFVKSYGGKVVRIPFNYKISTTMLIEKIRSQK